MLTPFDPGFQLNEATALLEICQQTYLNTPDQPQDSTPGIPPVPTPPDNWSRVDAWTPSDATLLDNYWEIWRNQNIPKQYAIAVRGTVNTLPSIFADLFLPLIQARTTLKVGPLKLEFNLAQAEPGSPITAGVHAGFALSLLLMLLTTDRPLLKTLMLDLEPDAQIYLTGHSQGASIALLLTSLLRHSTLLGRERRFKTYVYAPAKPGNDHYSYDWDQIAGIGGMGYSVISTQDWVPQVPLTLQFPNTVNLPNPLKGFPDGSTLPAELDAALKEGTSLVAHAEARVHGLIDDLKDKLFALPAPLQATAALTQEAPLSGGIIAEAVEQLRGQLLSSLNYAKAGTLVPLFATPGGNPEDPKDFFWQHHLGHYLQYLQTQYGG